jgi:hypothetical protein
VRLTALLASPGGLGPFEPKKTYLMRSLCHTGMADYAYRGGESTSRVTRGSIPKAIYGLLAGIRHFRWLPTRDHFPLGRLTSGAPCIPGGPAASTVSCVICSKPSAVCWPQVWRQATAPFLSVPPPSQIEMFYARQWAVTGSCRRIF